MAVTDDVVLVVGATGNQGGATARRLLADGWQVRALTRDPDSAAAKALAAAGAQLVVGNLDDRASLDRAVAGAAGVFSVQSAGGHDPAFSIEDEVRQGRAIADAAKVAGVRQFVYTSVGGAERGTGIPSWESKWQIEHYLREIELPLTVLAPVMFLENTLSNSPVGVQADGGLAYFLPPEVPIQVVAVEDIGAFAGLAFADPAEYLGQRLELAGDVISFEQIAAAIGAAADRSVHYNQIPLALFLGEDYEARKLYDLIEGDGVWRADIPALRAAHPGLLTFDKWLKRNLDSFRLA